MNNQEWLQREDCPDEIHEQYWAKTAELKEMANNWVTEQMDEWLEREGPGITTQAPPAFPPRSASHSRVPLVEDVASILRRELEPLAYQQLDDHAVYFRLASGLECVARWES